MDLARLAAGDSASIDGQEQDLSRAFPESTATVLQPINTPNDAAGLPFGQSGAKMAMLQLAQSGAM